MRFIETLISDAEKKSTKLNVLGVGVDNLTVPEALTLIENWVETHRTAATTPGRIVVTLNPEYIMAARRDPEFRQIIEQAALCTPDGAGLIACGKLWGQPFRGRVTGVALTHALAQRSAELAQQNCPFNLFLLGAAPGVADEAAAKLRELYPSVQIAGTFAGTAAPNGDAETLAKVREAKPDIVLVAYGMGKLKQDGWMARNLNQSGTAVAIGVGGVFDYLTGRAKLAPPLLRKLGLEWAYRLYNEPWRWKRMLALPQFAFLVLGQVPARRWRK